MPVNTTHTFPDWPRLLRWFRQTPDEETGIILGIYRDHQGTYAVETDKVQLLCSEQLDAPALQALRMFAIEKYDRHTLQVQELF